MRVAQLDELGARHRELGRNLHFAIGEHDDCGIRQLGAQAGAEPNHQLGVEIAHAHAVAGNARAELLNEHGHGDILQLVGELVRGQLLEPGAHG